MIALTAVTYIRILYLFVNFKGGSWVSTGDEASRFARFAFRRHFFQHLGFRVAQSIADSPPVRLVGTPVFVLGVGVEGKVKGDLHTSQLVTDPNFFHFRNWKNRVLTKRWVCEIMGYQEISGKSIEKNVHLPKMCILGQYPDIALWIHKWVIQFNSIHHPHISLLISKPSPAFQFVHRSIQEIKPYEWQRKPRQL